MREIKLLSISLLAKYALPVSFVLILKNTSCCMFCRKNCVLYSISLLDLGKDVHKNCNTTMSSMAHCVSEASLLSFHRDGRNRVMCPGVN